MSLLVFGVFCIFNFSPLFPLSNSNCLLTPAMKTNIVIWDKVFKRGLSEFIKGCLPQNLVIPLLNTLSHIFFMAKRNFKSHKFHFGSHVNTLSIPWFILLIYYFFLLWKSFKTILRKRLLICSCWSSWAKTRH